VKIYGVGGVSGVHGYQSGIIISPDGYILTAITPSLQTDTITVVLDSGKKYEAAQVNGDPLTEIVLLKIPATDLPYFDINLPNKTDTNTKTNTTITNADINTNTPNVTVADVSGTSERFGDAVRVGDQVFAVSNMFNIAEGNESATVQQGIIAARTLLKARRGVFDTPYQGEVFIVDVTTNNPGACGGALVLAETGKLAGMLGKELMNSENNSWLNFAIPTFVLRDKVQQLIEHATNKSKLIDPQLLKSKIELIPEDTIHQFQDWGILLVTSVSKRTPPFIDTIKPNSQAAKLGLQPDDLIVMINNHLTPSIKSVEDQINQSEPNKQIIITIERKMTLIDVNFKK
jgi:serine protease Do